MFLLALLSIVLMILDHHQRIDALRTTLSTVVMPLQYLVDWPIKMVNRLETDVTSYKRLLAENTRLRLQTLILQTHLQKLLALQQENNELRALLKSAPRGSGERILVAQVLAVNTDSFMHQIVLNKGSKDGVYMNQPVLDAGGIMGQLIQVGPILSRLLLVTDSRSAIPVLDSHTGLRGLVMGTGNANELSLAHVADTAEFKVGDILVTSGLGGRYPMGYPVGVISHIVRRLGEHFASIKVRPCAHLNQATNVILLWPSTKSQRLVEETLQAAVTSSQTRTDKALPITDR